MMALNVVYCISNNQEYIFYNIFNIYLFQIIYNISNNLMKQKFHSLIFQNATTQIMPFSNKCMLSDFHFTVSNYFCQFKQYYNILRAVFKIIKWTADGEKKNQWTRTLGRKLEVGN